LHAVLEGGRGAGEGDGEQGEARRYDIFNARPAPLIEPVAAMASSRSALPGPMATASSSKLRVLIPSFVLRA
jgi:hypothetical protein